jgi:phosphatidyl-myo-inositol dimannoside synthase
MTLMLTADYPPIEGGLSRFTEDLASQLHLLGQQPEVLAPYFSGTRILDSESPFPITRTRGYGLGWFRNWAMRAASYPGLRRRVQDFDRLLGINLVYAGGYGGFLSSRFDIPLDLCAFGYEFLKFRSIPLLHKRALSIYSRCDRILAISEYTRRQLAGFGVPYDKISLIPLGVDLDRFKPIPPDERLRRSLNIDDGCRVLLSVGRLIPRKGHDQVIRALSMLIQNNSDLVYVIVGRGPCMKKLRILVEQLALEKHVRFCGYVAEDLLPQFYNLADIFVLPNRRIGASVEGFGLVFWEAGACGKPVIGGNSGGTVEAIRQGETGYLIDPEDKYALVESISNFLDNPSRAQDMGKAARQWLTGMQLERPTVLAGLFGSKP